MWSVFSVSSVNAEPVTQREYSEINLNGIKINGCELYLENKTIIIGFNINNIIYYRYDKNEKVLKFFYSVMSDTLSKVIVDVSEKDIDSIVAKFIQRKNQCSFAPTK